MAHNLMNGSSFAGRQTQPAWHRLGKLMPDAETMEELRLAAGITWEYFLDPTFREFERSDGEVFHIMRKNQYALVRKEPSRLDEAGFDLGHTVGNDFEFHNPAQISQALDDILVASKKWDGCNWLPETALALGNGDKTCFVISLGDWNIKGDRMVDYLTVYDEVTGRGSLRAYISTVRAVCANTIAAGLRSAKVNLNIRHTRGHKMVFQQTIESILDSRGNVQKALTDLADILCTDEAFDEYVNRVFALPEDKEADDYEVECRRMGRLRSLAIAEWCRKVEGISLEGTAWKAFNCVQGTIEHGGEYGGVKGLNSALLMQMGEPVNAIRRAFAEARKI